MPSIGRLDHTCAVSRQPCVTSIRGNTGTNRYKSAWKFAMINLGAENRKEEKYSTSGKRPQYCQSVGYRNIHLCVCYTGEAFQTSVGDLFFSKGNRKVCLYPLYNWRPTTILIPCDGEGHYCPKRYNPLSNNTSKNPFGDFQAWRDRFLMDHVKETDLPKDDVFQVKRILNDASGGHSDMKHILLCWHK